MYHWLLYFESQGAYLCNGSVCKCVDRWMRVCIVLYCVCDVYRAQVGWIRHEVHLTYTIAPTAFYIVLVSNDAQYSLNLEDK